MFPPDALLHACMEEPAAPDAAKLAAKLQKVQSDAARKAEADASRKSKPLHMALTPAPLANPAATGFLGNVFHGFFTRPSAGSAAPSQSHTPALTPEHEKSAASVSEETEKLLAERRKDADMVASMAVFLR